METISFNDLQLSKKEDYKTFKFQDKEIQVLQYLPIESKITLSELALQQSEYEGVYNELALSAYFYTYVIFFYTNLEFTDEQKQNIFDTFDILETNNIISEVLQLIPENEWEELREFIDIQKVRNMTYKKSAAYLISQFINELPEQMDKVGEIINSFNPQKYAEVVNFATAANGGRNINTNEPMAPIE